MTTFPSSSKFIKNSPLRVVFPTLFSVFGNVIKHRLSCLVYYTKEPPPWKDNELLSWTIKKKNDSTYVCNLLLCLLVTGNTKTCVFRRYFLSSIYTVGNRKKNSDITLKRATLPSIEEVIKTARLKGRNESLYKIRQYFFSFFFAGCLVRCFQYEQAILVCKLQVRFCRQRIIFALKELLKTVATRVLLKNFMAFTSMLSLSDWFPINTQANLLVLLVSR